MSTELYTVVPFHLAMELVGYGPENKINFSSVDTRTNAPLVVAELESGEIIACYGGALEFGPNIDLPARNFLLPNEYGRFNLSNLLISLLNEKIEKIVLHLGYLDGWDQERFLMWKKLSKEEIKKHGFDKNDFIRLRQGLLIKRRQQILKEYEQVFLSSKFIQTLQNKKDFDLFRSDLGVQALQYYFEESDKAFSSPKKIPTLDQQEDNPEQF